eukprot:TRINITY_DN3936_c0_g1_i1.p1 TRINITY_DN3936_c0_g1~~TRINITY_DN3936_c0_g1_i1.p1  ORF type:complete len:258 (+),score=78.99 TRINITY_DN3936_c0_g1_i1:85-858(+)
MAVGKNKGLKIKKGAKKKIVDPFTRKEWYDVKAPSTFNATNVGKTTVNKTAGTKIASDSLKGRVLEVNLADLQKEEDQSHRKIKLVIEEVQGSKCLTNFYGMDLTTDKLRSLVRKWQTLIEAFVDVKTTDGYFLRLFAIAFTSRRKNQLKRTSYAQTAQVKQIRRKMMDIMTKEATTSELKDLVKKFIPEAIGKQIERECQSIYPLKDVFVRKVKVLKAPKFDSAKLNELYTETASAKAAEPKTTVAPVSEETGAKV